MAKLSTYVHVDGKMYGPGDDVPDGVAAMISNPDVWDGKPPPGAGSGVKAQPMSPVVTSDAAKVTAERDAALAEIAALKAGGGTSDGSDGGVPPRGGAGSGKDAWSAYAASKGVDVDAEASRDDIIAALDDAGVPTE